MLASKLVIEEHSLNRIAFDWTLGEIKSRFTAALAVCRGCPVYLRSSLLKMSKQLEYTTLKEVVANTEIIYDPDPTSTIIEEDLDFVQAYYKLPDE